MKLLVDVSSNLRAAAAAAALLGVGAALLERARPRKLAGTMMEGPAGRGAAGLKRSSSLLYDVGRLVRSGRRVPPARRVPADETAQQTSEAVCMHNTRRAGSLALSPSALPHDNRA